PVWQMGKSITISSATMANKGMEILEAKELFGFNLAQIKAVIHPQAKIHAMLRLSDGSLITHVSPTTMVEPALHALTYPLLSPGEDLEIASLKIEFHAIKPGQFPMLELAYEAGRRGHMAQIVYTTANEIANDYFLREKIRFSQIAQGVEKILSQISDKVIDGLDAILRVDREAREVSNGVFKEYSSCPY
ncbi:MAG: 1-deoxy-D-xylulose-5-phosphate reductoisomerase, partial [Spirochaetae bacterium HGW-Spirochaetae-6]